MLLKSVSPYSALFKISSRASDLVPAKRAYSDHQIDFGLQQKHTKKLKSWIKPKYSEEINSKTDQVFVKIKFSSQVFVDKFGKQKKVMNCWLKASRVKYSTVSTVTSF